MVRHNCTLFLIVATLYPPRQSRDMMVRGERITDLFTELTEERVNLKSQNVISSAEQDI